MSKYNTHENGVQGRSCLSAEAIAAALGTSEWRLFAWLQHGRDLGIRFDLLPLLPDAYGQLSAEGHPMSRRSLVRERLVLTPRGVEPVDIDEPDEHARIDRHWEAVGLAVLTGDDRALRRFAGLSVCGIEFAAEYDRLVYWAESTLEREEP